MTSVEEGGIIQDHVNFTTLKRSNIVSFLKLWLVMSLMVYHSRSSHEEWGSRGILNAQLFTASIFPRLCTYKVTESLQMLSNLI